MRTYLGILGALLGGALPALFVSTQVTTRHLQAGSHTLVVGLAVAAGALLFGGRGNALAWIASGIAVLMAVSGKVLAWAKHMSGYGYNGYKPLIDAAWFADLWPAAKQLSHNLRPMDFLFLVLCALLAAGPILVRTHYHDDKLFTAEQWQRRAARRPKLPGGTPKK